MPGVVTISASFGAHGYKIGRALAERLDLPFVDRAIPADVAHQLDLPADEAESFDEPVPSFWERIAKAFANTSSLVGPTQLQPDVVDTPDGFRATAASKLVELADTTGAVVLGRAGMVVLGGRPNVLCVRLDGPVEARIAQVVAEGTDEENARRIQHEVDRARDAYARVFFNARQDDPHLYHLVLDSTVLSATTCVDVIVRAARDRLGTRLS